MEESNSEQQPNTPRLEPNLQRNNEPLGIFTSPDQRASQMVSLFFADLFKGVSAIEEMAYTQFEDVADPRLAYLNELTHFLTNVVTLPTDKSQHAQLLTYPKTLDSGKKATSPLYSYEAEAFPYRPSIQPTPTPTTLYKFDLPASVEFRITNNRAQEVLVIQFFPIRYSDYGRGNLIGATEQQAREALELSSIRGNTDQIREAIQKGQESTIEPYFQIRLEDQSRQLLSAIRGNQTVENGITGFRIGLADFPNQTTFLALPGKEAKDLEENVPAKNLISYLANLQIRDISRSKPNTRRP